MAPLGYVIMQPTMRLDRPVKAYRRWLDRIPSVFATAVLGQDSYDPTDRTYEIATLKNSQSLMPLAHDARKPMFDLRSADGAIGSTQTYVQRCYKDFKNLSKICSIVWFRFSSLIIGIRFRWATPADIYGRSVRGRPYCGAGSPGQYLASDEEANASRTGVAGGSITELP
jgi:hypothetical protein